MFSYFEKRARNLAFRTDSSEFARQGVYTFAESTLAAWLQGQERAYAVQDVLREIRAVFGIGGEGVAALIEDALRLPPDDERRHSMVCKAVDLLGRQLRGNPDYLR